MTSGGQPEWTLVRRIFEECVELDEPTRTERVRELCAGDAALLAEVHGLLAADTDTDELRTHAPAELFERIVSSTPRPGDVMGPFELRSKIGEGGMGTVFLAEHENQGRSVALKVCNATLDPVEGRQRFELEVESLAKMQHAGIAQIFEAGVHRTQDGREHPWFAMEYVDDARELESWCIEHRAHPERVLAQFVKICDAIQHGHGRGVIHRDLKPANILIDREGNPKVIDFGIAKSTAETSVRDRMTTAGSVLGTLPYMSPEQLESRLDDIDTTTDVFALGVVLYQMLTAELPRSLSGISLAKAAQHVRTQPVRSLSDARRGLAPELDLVVQTAMAGEARDRYPSAAALAEDVRRVLDHEPIRAKTALPLATHPARAQAPRGTDRMHGSRIGGIGPRHALVDRIDRSAPHDTGIRRPSHEGRKRCGSTPEGLHSRGHRTLDPDRAPSSRSTWRRGLARESKPAARTSSHRRGRKTVRREASESRANSSRASHSLSPRDLRSRSRTAEHGRYMYGK